MASAQPPSAPAAGVDGRRPYDRTAGFDTATHQRYLVWLAYDGADFNGWQAQVAPPRTVATAAPPGSGGGGGAAAVAAAPAVATVQGALELRLSRALCHGAPTGVAVAGCGRTDAGVHAAAYAFHFEAPRAMRLKQQKRTRASANDGGGGDDEDDVARTGDAPAVTGGAASVDGGDAAPALAAGAVSSSRPGRLPPKPLQAKEDVAVDAAFVVRLLRSGLPPALQVLSAVPVAPDFHARSCCTGKRYEYRILETPPGSHAAPSPSPRRATPGVAQPPQRRARVGRRGRRARRRPRVAARAAAAAVRRPPWRQRPAAALRRPRRR